MNSSYPLLDPNSSQTSSPRGRCALGMMIKAPRAGASKTRLVPPLTHEEAARLSAGFLRDTAANIADACAESFGHAAHGVAVYTPVGAEKAFDGLLPRGFALLAQRGDTFGERLFHASADLLRLGYESCCLIDSDSPTLPRALLTMAVAELRRPGDRLVLGPSDDGGYYLIGVKRAHPRLFEEIAWSTAEVSRQTIARAREIDLDVSLLPVWYDVDDAHALLRLCDELFDAPADNAPRDAKGEASPDAKGEASPDAKGEASPDAKSDSSPDIKSDVAREAKADAARDAKGDGAPDARGDAAPDVKGNAARDAKGHAIRDERDDATRDAKGDGAPDASGDAVRDASLTPYAALHTRAELARLLDAEGRARLRNEIAVARAREDGLA